MLNLTCWRCEDEEGGGVSLRVLGVIHLQQDLRICFSESRGCYFSLQTWTWFWHRFPHSRNICLPALGEYPRRFVWMEVIYSTNRVIAGTGRPPEYQSITRYQQFHKRLVVGGSLSFSMALEIRHTARRLLGWVLSPGVPARPL